MNTTIAGTPVPAPAPRVIVDLTAQRDKYRADADRIAADLAIAPTVDDLNRAEEELLAQLADVRRRRTDRAVRDSEHRAAAEAADFFDGLIERTRVRIEQGPTVSVQDRPRPDPDPLAGPAGIITDSREEVAGATSGAYPAVLPPPVPSAPSGPFVRPDAVEVAAQVREGLVALDAPGAVVATHGPTVTMPDPSAQPAPAPTPADEPAAEPAPAAPAQSGARHKRERGSRK